MVLYAKGSYTRDFTVRVREKLTHSQTTGLTQNEFCGRSRSRSGSTCLQPIGEGELFSGGAQATELQSWIHPLVSHCEDGAETSSVTKALISVEIVSV